MTIYVRVVDGIITDETFSPVYGDGDTTWFLTEPLSQEHVDAGWQIAQETGEQRPPDTNSTTWSRGLTLIAGVAVHGWIERLKTAAEIRAALKEANRGVITADVVVNFGAILAVLDSMNAITGTANTAINTNPASVIKVLARDLKTVTRQLVRLAQIVTGETDSIDIAP